MPWGGGLAAETLGGTDRVAPIGEPATPSPQPPTVSDSAEAPPGSPGALEATIALVPGWASYVTVLPDLRDFDPWDKGTCSGNWTGGAVVGGEPSRSEVTMYYTEVSGHPAGIFISGFPSEARASNAAARLVAGLESCTATAWRTQPIPQTGAVLASSADVVVWIQQQGADVKAFQVPTTDGPPPAGVQVEVAEWMAAFRPAP